MKARRKWGTIEIIAIIMWFVILPIDVAILVVLWHVHAHDHRGLLSISLAVATVLLGGVQFELRLWAERIRTRAKSMKESQ